MFPRRILLITSKPKLSPPGLSEVTGTSFFRYCQIHYARVAPRTQDERPRASSHIVVQSKTLPNGQKHEEEVEMLTEFSWRNFFSSINFAKIMQKLSKSRSHRIWMLVQYKSSVSGEMWNKVLRLICPLLDLGCAQAGASCPPPDVAASCSQTNQESSAFLWSQMAAM